MAGSRTGAILGEDVFGVFNRDEVLLIAHQFRDGSPTSEHEYLSRRPRVREGRTLFTVGHLAAATAVYAVVDGQRLLTLSVSGSNYIFGQFDAGRHRFAFRHKGTRELLAVETIWMPEGAKWFVMLYGDAASGYRIRAFRRAVGVR